LLLATVEICAAGEESMFPAASISHRVNGRQGIETHLADIPFRERRHGIAAGHIHSKVSA
jgi:hypothetical protein